MRSPPSPGPRGEPAAEQPALAGPPRWADRDEPEVGVERRGAIVARGDAEVDPWHVGQGVEQRLEQAATGTVPLRPGSRLTWRWAGYSTSTSGGGPGG